MYGFVSNLKLKIGDRRLENNEKRIERMRRMNKLTKRNK
jgi:hypothetical protein